MSFVIEHNKVCPLRKTCPYAKDLATGHFCQGTVTREGTFICDYVKDGKVTNEGKLRLRGDKTGKMNVIMG